MITMPIGHSIAYAVALLAFGFLLGIIAKVFKDQIAENRLRKEKPWTPNLFDDRPTPDILCDGIVDDDDDSEGMAMIQCELDGYR